MLAANGATAEVTALLDSAMTMPPDSRHTPSEFAGVTLAEAVAHDRTAPVHAIDAWMSAHEAALASSRASAAIAATVMQRWEKVAALSGNSANDTTVNRYEMLGDAGIAAAKLGDRGKALEIEHRIAASTAERMAKGASRRAAFQNSALNAQAAIAGALGEYARAVELLKGSSSHGWDTRLYHLSPVYPMLRAYPGFQDLLKPRG